MDTKHADDIRYMMGSLGGKLNVISGINRAGKSHALSIFAQKKENNIFYHHYKVDAMINHKWNRFYSNNKDKIIPNTNKTIKDLCDFIDSIQCYRNLVMINKDDLPKCFLFLNLSNQKKKYYQNILWIQAVYDHLKKDEYWQCIPWDFYAKIISTYDTNITSLLFNIVEPSLFFLQHPQREDTETFKVNINSFQYNQLNDDLNNKDVDFDYSAVDNTFEILGVLAKYKIIDFNKPKTERSFNKYLAISDGQKSIAALIMISFFIEKGYNFLSNAGTLVNNKPDYILLDEPDAFLNPQIIQTMLKIIREEFVEKDIKVIMTTHNPSTVAYCQEDEIFWMEDGKILKDNDKKSKESILDQLADGLILVKKDNLEIIAKLSNALQNNNSLIFVEGGDDVKYLNKIIANKCIIPCGGAGDIPKWITFVRKISNNNKIIAIFDNDEAGRKGYDNMENGAILLEIGKTKEEAQKSKAHFDIEYFFYNILIDKNNNIKTEYSDFFSTRHDCHQCRQCAVPAGFEGLYQFYNKYKLIEDTEINNNLQNLQNKYPQLENMEKYRRTLELKEILCKKVCLELEKPENSSILEDIKNNFKPTLDIINKYIK